MARWWKWLLGNDNSRQMWQIDALEQVPPGGQGSLPKFPHVYASSRAYPDLSALAGVVNAYLVALEGGKRFASVGASCLPGCCGIVAQINDRRLSRASRRSAANPALFGSWRGFSTT